MKLGGSFRDHELAAGSKPRFYDFGRWDLEMVITELDKDLSDDEISAISAYGADSTFLHATSQSRSADFSYDPNYQAFTVNAARTVTNLDAAIGASRLSENAVLHSAHGIGCGVRGSLIGPPRKFVGLTYHYPGYISTTSDSDLRDRFLAKRRGPGTRPTILELHLPSGFNALDMRHGGHFGEFEFLLGRNLHLIIVDAELVDGDVLSLVLKPAGDSQKSPVCDRARSGLKALWRYFHN